MMKKVFSILGLLILVIFISGCTTTTEPVTPPEPATDTAVDTGLSEIGGELTDIDTSDSEDYDLGDINIDEDLPPL